MTLNLPDAGVRQIEKTFKDIAADWVKDCVYWRGRILRGPDAHWCNDWDGLPIDATTPEYGCCSCYKKTLWGRIVNWAYMVQLDLQSRV